MIGRFIASSPGAPCCRCGRSIPVGGDVYYETSVSDDAGRTCGACASKARPLTIGSLFTGYGGLDMATEAAFGARTAWVSDIDKGACKLIAHRYPDVPNLGDITTVDWSVVEPVDIITGGSPCQDLSHAGRRAGMTVGTRSNLWVAMREAIAQVRPTYVIWENVRGAYSACADSEVDRELGRCPRCVDPDSRAGHAPNLRALGRVLGDLSDLGYDTQWRGLRAADVGAPHGRFRVFIVAHLADTPSDGWHEGRTESAGIVGRPDAAKRGSTVGLALLPTPMAQEPGGTAEQYQARWKKSDGRDSSFLPLSMAIRLLPTPSVADIQGGRKGRSGDRSDELLLNGIAHEQRFRQYAPAIACWEGVVGRPAPAPTEPTGRNGAHRLSPRFTEWMMGLPSGWITDAPDITRNEALKLCGNGVVPQQAFAAVDDCLRAEAMAA